jgi:FkbM family methyltransferase
MKIIYSIITATLITLVCACAGCSEAPTPTFKSAEKVWKKVKTKLGFADIFDQKRLYSYGMEELIIRDFFQDSKGLFFVDVGCAWPVRASNTYFLEKHLGWSGIGIDALSDYAAEWKEKRPRSKFFSYLVSTTSGDNATFYKSEDPGISSVHPHSADGTSFGPFFGRTMQTKKIHVPTISLNDLFDREGISAINLLSIDVEGHEMEVLAGFDLNRFSPDLIVIETWDKEPVLQHLGRYGYHPIKRYDALDKVNIYFSRTPEPTQD